MMTTALALAQEVKTRKLFSLPDIVIRLNTLLEQPSVTNIQVGELLMSDPALAARTLKVANSALYSLPSKVETISTAIALLGLDRIRNLVFTTCVADAFKDIPAEWVDMDRFWLNSVGCGVFARSLAFRRRIFDAEPLFMAGLLHKVGRLVFYCCRPDEYRQVLLSKDEGEAAMIREEVRVFGFSHALLGAELLKLWHLPERLHAIVAHYPQPLSSIDYQTESAIVNIASELSPIIEPGVSLAELISEESITVNPEIWGFLGLADETLPAVIQDAWVQTFDILHVIRPSIHSAY